ncbi:MAG: aspartoacylase [Cyanobacteria bacterium K_DeepCast_35m_m2_023]|nr:aspartoacylase [Cyanobacteria bacterium K_DeepCast_35m_m2_023]
MPTAAPLGGSILVVAGTHGNECNAPWLLQQWRANPSALEASGLPLALVHGNPEAAQIGRRYVDRDLNRCFAPWLLADRDNQSLEMRRARALLEGYGPCSSSPALVAFDLHSTTAAMGNSLVVYGRRPVDLALAAGIQQQLGLPIYLHEADPAQTGFLVERWPCGLVIEVGPVPQGVLDAAICRQTQLALEAGLAVLAAAASGCLRLPAELVVHRHRASIDLPRQSDGTPAALLHPQLQGADWQPLRPGDPVLCAADGAVIALRQLLPQGLRGCTQLWPVFINEAAYREKGIAFSLTTRECWPLPEQALGALQQLAARLRQAGDAPA